MSIRKQRRRVHAGTARRWRNSWRVTRWLREQGREPSDFWSKLEWDVAHPVIVED